jgi:hypothetical protein
MYLVATLASFLLAAPLAAQQSDDTPEYVPPSRGAPPGRVGGGTRGLQALPLTALAPGHIGLTLSAQPVLYYYTPAVARLRVTLRPAGDAAAAPLLDQELATPRSAGIQRLDLGTLGVKLAPGVEYRWAVVLAGETREAGAIIQRVEPSAELVRKLAGTSGRSRYALLAKEGIWYDALDEVSRAVDTAPGNTASARHRAALLEQIGLTAVARAERQRFE